MTNVRRLISAFVVAIGVAVAFASIDVIAQADCGILGCFEPGLEGEMWQSLSPWGSLQTAAVDENNIQEGECTNSHFDDDLDVARQCKIGGLMLPPPLGKMMYPFALAVDGIRVYVSDQFNHRIQAFDFAGTPIPLAHPIGDGVPGSGQYTDALGRTGQRLRAPEGIAVDAGGKLLVADSYNGRVAIFNDDGTVAFGTEVAPINSPVVSTIAEVTDPVPTGIAITPNTTVLSPGTPVPDTDNGRIVVTDRDQCSVFIYDRGFKLLKQLPEPAPPASAQGVCVYPNGNTFAPAGFFGSATGVAIDEAGHIYVADYDNSRVAILDSNGTWLGSFGQPPANAVPGPESLQAPWGIMVDHNQRVVVTDSDNQRISFYSVDYTGANPVATYQFQLNAGGTLNGFPTGIAEQVSSNDGVDGLDPAGRILTTDTQHHRVQRFQLPDLAIVSAAAAGGIGSFEVVVPKEKADDVNGVTATVVPVEGGVTVDAISALPPAAPATNDIEAGQTVKYQFTYTTALAIVHFKINASGNGGSTAAPEVIVEATAPCANCGAAHVINNYPIVNPAVAATSYDVSGATWYAQKVYARVTPTGTDTVTKIGWFVQGTAVATHGGWIHSTDINGGNPPYADIEFTEPGTSILSYWPITADGRKGTRIDVPIRVDLFAPDVEFSGFTPASGVDGSGNLWNKTNVTVNYVVTDAGSGTTTPSGSLSFTNEGRNQSQTVHTEDNVEHYYAAVSSSTHAGGRFVNIDKGAPSVSAPMNMKVDVNTTGGAVLPGWNATATDPLLTNGDAGSGVVSITNPGTFIFPIGKTSWQFIATDAAGNQSNAVTRTVTVNAITSSIVSTNASVVYGQTLNVSATVTPAFATGTVTFTFGSRTATATIAGGVATASFPLVIDNAATYTMQVAYGGASAIPAASTTAQVTVTKAPLNITAAAKTKQYGDADPALTYTASGLVGGDTISGALSRVAGENVGSYAIQVGTLSASSNYTVNFTPSALTITARAVTIKADAKQRNVGDPDPALTYAITSGTLVPGDTFSGALARVAGELPGDYTITIGTLTLGSNYALTFIPSKLTILSVAITVTANPISKVYGSVDPPLTFTWVGPVTLDRFSGSLTRQTGEGVGNYPITQGTLSLPEGYVLLFHSGNFNIQPRPVTVTVQNATRYYGDPNPSFGAVAAGLLPGDTLQYQFFNFTSQTSDVGTYPIKVVVGDNHNYLITIVTGELSITPRPVTVTAGNAIKVYGDPDVPIGVTVSGFLFGEPYSTSVSRASGENAGSYATNAVLSGAGASNPNYAIIYVPGTFVIQRRPATMAAGGGTKVYGGVDPAITATGAGFFASDGITFTATRDGGENVGSYATHPVAVGAAASNYQIAPTTGVFTITPAAATIAANPASKNYGDNNPAFTASVTGAMVGDTLNYALNTTATQTSSVGSYPITVTAGSNPNYNVSVVSSSLTVGPKAITVTANAASKPFGAADPVLTYSLSAPLVGSDTFSGSLSREAGEDIGVYRITQGSLSLSPNYVLLFIGADFTIVIANHEPVCNAASGGEVWPPNHKQFYPATINGVTDADHDAINITITGIWQDEKLDSTGDGQFSPDGYGIGGSTAWIRAERNGHGNKAPGNGRVYKILFTATDGKGGSCDGSVLWTVPHDQGQRAAAINDGTTVDSTGVAPGTRNKP